MQVTVSKQGVLRALTVPRSRRSLWSCFIHCPQLPDDVVLQEGSSLSVVVVGASGDLAKKKIFPALFALYYEGLLPKVEAMMRAHSQDPKPTSALPHRCHSGPKCVLCVCVPFTGLSSFRLRA